MKVSKTMRKDPMQTRGHIRDYERKLLKPFKELKTEAASLLGRHSREMSRELEADVNTVTYSKALADLIYNLVYDPLNPVVLYYTEQSYKKGAKFSVLALNRVGLNVSEYLFPVDWRALDILKTRNLTALKGITEETNKAIIRELTAGMQKGEGLPKLAKRINDRIENIGMARARKMAREETNFAFRTATDTRYRQYGIRYVEWLTGQDERVCEECAARDGKIYRIDEVPDFHFGCRCTTLAVPDAEVEK